MEADDTDYKDQARYLLADLNQRYIMLQRPTWFTMPILLPLILIICALTAILANCYIEPSTIVSGVLEQTETIEGKYNISSLIMSGCAHHIIKIKMKLCMNYINTPQSYNKGDKC